MHHYFAAHVMKAGREIARISHAVESANVSLRVTPDYGKLEKSWTHEDNSERRIRANDVDAL